MKFMKLTILITVVSVLSAVSLWEDGSFFSLQLRTGDILKVHFQEKKVLKFEQQLKKNDNQNLKGKLISGEAWGFIPMTTISENDDTASKKELTIKQEKDLYVPVKITAITNRTVYLQGKSASLINGDTMELTLKGQSDINRIASDLSLASQDIYDLRFEVVNSSEQNDKILNMDDLIFETNYSDIQSNILVNNNQTNLVVSTNRSSLSLKFKSVQDDKKKEMVLFYLNTMIKNLFY